MRRTSRPLRTSQTRAFKSSEDVATSRPSGLNDTPETRSSCPFSVRRSAEASSAPRRATMACVVGSVRTASAPMRIASSGSNARWLSLSAASSRDLATALSASARRWLSCAALRCVSATIPSTTDTARATAIAPTSSRILRAAAARLTSTYSRWSGVGSGSLPAASASQPSAAPSSAPRSSKLESRPSRSHSRDFSSQRVCCSVHSRSVSSARTRRSRPASKPSAVSNGIQLRTRIGSGSSLSATWRYASGTICLWCSSAWSTSWSQNEEPIESGLMTRTKAFEPSTADRIAAGNTSPSRMPSVSSQTSLPRA